MFFLLRRIGMIIRGTATPLQLTLACLLGGAIGFNPGFERTPGLLAALVLLLVLLNANLFLAGLVMVVGKALSALATPLTFGLGRLLLDGPLGGFFATLINGPVTAWFGLDYYVATGGLALGALYGLGCAVGSVRFVGRFRRKMAELERSSERFQRTAKNPLVRAAAWVFFGGRGKDDTWTAQLGRRLGNPLRPLGLVLVVLSALLATMGWFFLQDEILTAATRSGLERANGATVDVGSVHLDPAENRLTIRDLEMADRSQLDHNAFSATRLEGDVSGMDLLRRRVALDRVVITGARIGEPRRVPGRHTRLPPLLPPIEAPEGGWPLEEVIEKAKVWKERIRQVAEWLDRIRQGGGRDAGSVRERIEREILALGYQNVRASHLVREYPAFTVKEIYAGGVTIHGLPGEALVIAGKNLSSHPDLLPEPPEVTARSAGTEQFRLRFSGGGLAAGRPANEIEFAYRGLSAEKVAGMSKRGLPITGGVIDIEAAGTYDGERLDIPVDLTVNGATLGLGGVGRALDRLPLRLRIGGTPHQPTVHFDLKSIQKTLLGSLGGNLADLLGGELGGLLGGKNRGEGGAAGSLGDILQGVLGGDPDGEGSAGGDNNDDPSPAGSLLRGILGGGANNGER